MKTLFPLSLLLILTIGCKKHKETPNEISTPKTDSTSHTKRDSLHTVSINKGLKEISLAETSKLLNTNNDTLYVTNFFATWCGPCRVEVPYFKEKIHEMKGQPVKFTFVDLDTKENWPTEVSSFADKMGIREHTVLLDGQSITDQFFSQNFKEWKGEFIPFTFLKKGKKSKEILGSISRERLASELKAFD